MFEGFRRRRRRKLYRRGAVLNRFVAPDVRREIEIVDDSEIDDGFVVARVRTWNVLYAVKLGVTPPQLGEPRRIAVDELWTWRGQAWGGPVPDGSE